MKILYVGDVMAAPGRQVLANVLPTLRKDLNVDLVIAQAENSHNNGKGPRPQDVAEMQSAGVDFFTGGNHNFSNPETKELYEDPEAPLIRPLNVDGKPGAGYRIIEVNNHSVFIASMLGQTVGNQKFEITNPLLAVDRLLELPEVADVKVRVINFHGDFSSEKRVFGYYLDGRASLVVGDHWHVPTADAMVMPKGTAHITDVGMCGTLHSSLGVKTSVIVERWKSNKSSRNEIETEGPLQFNAVLADIDENTGRARSIQQIQRVID